MSNRRDTSSEEFGLTHKYTILPVIALQTCLERHVTIVIATLVLIQLLSAGLDIYGDSVLSSLPSGILFSPVDFHPDVLHYIVPPKTTIPQYFVAWR